MEVPPACREAQTLRMPALEPEAKADLGMCLQQWQLRELQELQREAEALRIKTSDAEAAHGTRAVARGEGRGWMRAWGVKAQARRAGRATRPATGARRLSRSSPTSARCCGRWRRPSPCARSAPCWPLSSCLPWPCCQAQPLPAATAACGIGTAARAGNVSQLAVRHDRGQRGRPARARSRTRKLLPQQCIHVLALAAVGKVGPRVLLICFRVYAL